MGELFEIANILPIPRTIISRAISLRQKHKMSLGDAIIASTAVEHGVTLVTRNTNDFEWIDGLNVYNPIRAA